MIMYDALPSDTILDRYRIEKVLGRGGFGITYKAIHQTLGNITAIKEFFPQEHAHREHTTGHLKPFRSSEDYQRGLKRFIREGQILATLNHPSIVKVTDLFEDKDTAYLVMEFIEGKTLRDELDSQPERCLRPSQIGVIIESLVEALSTVHEKGIYHLDIKPENVLITPEGLPKLIDFGAARQNLGGKTTQAFSAAYAPPEVIAGSTMTASSDIFEMGMMLHEMLTGELPPSGTARLTHFALKQEDCWDSSGLNSPWRELLIDALQLQIEQRSPTIIQWWEKAKTYWNQPIINQTAPPTDQPAQQKPLPSIQENQQAINPPETQISPQPIITGQSSTDHPAQQEPIQFIQENQQVINPPETQVSPKPVITEESSTPKTAFLKPKTVILSLTGLLGLGGLGIFPWMNYTTAQNLIKEGQLDEAKNKLEQVKYWNFMAIPIHNSLNYCITVKDGTQLQEAIAKDCEAIYLDTSLNLAGNFRLEGNPNKKPTIISVSPASVIKTNGGTLTLKNLNFEYQGSNAAHIVEVNGMVDISNCTFRAAKRIGDRGGSGILFISGGGQVRESRFENNELSGINVEGSASPVLENNIFLENGNSGIAYFSKAGGTARGNSSENNILHGIAVAEGASPTLENNTLLGNEDSGIAYFDNAGGTARGNLSQNNESQGIAVGDQASPTLVNNILLGNEDSGIAYFDNAGGTARENRAENNEKYGIYVGRSANPTVENNNILLDNGENDFSDNRL